MNVPCLCTLQSIHEGVASFHPSEMHINTELGACRMPLMRILNRLWPILPWIYHPVPVRIHISSTSMGVGIELTRIMWFAFLDPVFH